jgi:uncharacterized protein involved in tolerance to divalent cations
LSSKLISSIKEIHPHIMPEITFTEIMEANREYADWVIQSTMDDSKDDTPSL